MEQKIEGIFKVLIVIIVGFWILSKIPFNQNISQEIPAHIYENGVITGETTVIIVKQEVHPLCL